MTYMRTALVAVAMIALTGALALSVPTPSDSEQAWQLDVDLEEFQAVQVKLDDGPATFWFIRYTVTNQTGEDQVFVPQLELYTDTGEVVRAGRGVSPKVFDYLKETYSDPLMKDQTGMTGKILQGQDNAKTGVAIFQHFDPKAATVELFIGGLSGETQEIKLPKPVKVVEKVGNKTVETTQDTIRLTKQLKLEYEFKGDPSKGSARGKLVLVRKSWVMR